MTKEIELSTATIEKVSPPLAAETETGGRVYVHPITGEVFDSVTTILSIIDKTGLPYWYGKQSSICAVEYLKALTAAPWAPPCDGQHCGRCLGCLMKVIQHAGDRERDAAADRGTRFHRVAEMYALTGAIIGHDQDIAGHVLQFLDFVRVHKVEFLAAEVTVLSRYGRYAGAVPKTPPPIRSRFGMLAGTLDTVIACGWMPPKHRDLIGVPMFADYKTGSIYGTAGLQLAGYRNAETALLPDGTEVPLPGAHTETGLSIQIKADGWWVRPCPVGRAAHSVFRRTVALWRCINQPDFDLVGRAMYKPRTKKEA